MIALDTSAIVAIALSEQEAEAFARIIALQNAVIGTPTLLEARLVLTSRMPSYADQFIEQFVGRPSIQLVAFSVEMYRAALRAHRRFGRGQGHPARLNFGDCMAYAVAKVQNLPLLYKGEDFARTDIGPVLH